MTSKIVEKQIANLRASLEHYLGKEKAEQVWREYEEVFPVPSEMVAHLSIDLAESVLSCKGGPTEFFGSSPLESL